MEASSSSEPIKVGVIAELTGPLSFMGIADANVARMVVDDINAAGGLLGQQVELDRRGRRDRRRGRRGGAPPSSCSEDHVDVIFGGIFSSTRQAIKGRRGHRRQDALHLPRAVRGAGVRPADLLHRPGAGAAGRSADPVADGADGRQEVRAAVGRLHLAARHERQGPRDRHRARRRDRARRTTTRSITWTTARPSRRSCPSGAEVVFNTIVPPGVVPFFAAAARGRLHERGGHLVCTYFDENCLGLVPPEQVEGLYSCLDYYQDVDDPFSKELLEPLRPAVPGQRPVHRRRRVLGHVPRPAASGRPPCARPARSTRTT